MYWPFLPGAKRYSNLHVMDRTFKMKSYMFCNYQTIYNL